MGFQTHARINAVVPYAESHLAMFKPPAILEMRSLGLAASLVVMLPYCRVRRRAVQPRGRRRFNIRFSRYPGRCPALMVSGATSDGRPSRGSCSRSVHSHPRLRLVLWLRTQPSRVGALISRTSRCPELWTPRVATNLTNTVVLGGVHLARHRIIPLAGARRVLMECNNLTVVNYLI